MSKALRIASVVVLVLVLILLIGPFLIPVPELEGTLPSAQLADPDSQFVTIDGVDVHYKTFGDGEQTLILLHGFGSSLYTWREVLEPLGKKYRVIAFDRPAFGLTERPLEWGGENPYSAEFQTKLVMGLMDRLGVKDAVLVGNSAGGSIAMLTALRHPERVNALILISPAVYRGGGSPNWTRWLLSTPQMEHVGPLIARRIQDWGRDFAESAWHDPSKLTPEIWAGYTQALRVENWDKALWNLTRASRDLRLDDSLEMFDLPVLVITGDDDRIVPTDESIRLASEVPAADLVVLESCGHIPQEECHEPFLEAIMTFMEQLDNPQGD